MIRSKLIAFFVLLIILPLLGCSETTVGFPSTKLEGTISIMGTPVDKGTLQVISKEKQGLVSQGQIAAGKFIIPDAPLGEVTILIQATRATGKMNKEYSSEFPEIVNLVPKKYQQGIPYTIKKDATLLELDWK